MPAGTRRNTSKCPASKPIEIYNKDTGKHYGCSTPGKAASAARARNAASHGWKPTGKGRK